MAGKYYLKQQAGHPVILRFFRSKVFRLVTCISIEGIGSNRIFMNNNNCE